MTTSHKDGPYAGQCLCGAVSFEATGEITRISACYCGQCRVQNGGSAFHGVELRGALNMTEDRGLKWYDSSSKAERGFCSDCGSSLFWRLKSDPSQFDISLGTLKDATGLDLDAHIFVDNAAPYQIVPDTAPHFTEADLLSPASQDT